jgi:Flp pilus assembly protein TadG
MKCSRNGRSGNVLILTLLMLTAVVAITAFAIDLGYLCTARTELQRSADSAAIAATWRLIDPENLVMSDDMSAATAAAKSTAAQFAALNPVGSANPALTDDDVKVGYLSDPSNPDLPMDYSDPNRVNAVQVRVRRNTELNGNVPYFFAPIMGSDSQGTEAWATAAVLTAFQGFQAPESGENLDFLPFALDKETWDNMMAGGGDDDWYWDPESSRAATGYEKSICTPRELVRPATVEPSTSAATITARPTLRGRLCTA